MTDQHPEVSSTKHNTEQNHGFASTSDEQLSTSSIQYGNYGRLDEDAIPRYIPDDSYVTYPWISPHEYPETISMEDNAFYTNEEPNPHSAVLSDTYTHALDTTIRHSDDNSEDADSDNGVGTLLQEQYGLCFEDTDSEVEHDTDEPATIKGTTKPSLNNRNLSSEQSSASSRPAHKSDRILQPIEYARKLDALAREIFKLSFLTSVHGQFQKETTPWPDSILAPFTNWSTSDTLTFGSFCPSQAVNELYTYIRNDSLRIGSGSFLELQNNTYLDFINSRNIIHIVALNIHLMRSLGYCSDFISVLVSDNKRSNVARLVPIKCSTVFDLLGSFESVMKTMIRVYTEENYHYSGPPVWELLISNVLPGCRSILQSLGPIEKAVSGDMSLAQIIRTTVQVLDIAVLCYVTAHIPDSAGANLWGSFPGQIDVLPAFESALVFEPRRFLCLDEFLGHSTAWVCQISRRPTINRSRKKESLYLSTRAETFADIWGPMWSCHSLKYTGMVTNYRVGNGVILPWKEEHENVIDPKNSTQDQHIPGQLGQTNTGEVMCHWMSDKDYDNYMGREHVAEDLLSVHDILLIGARKTLDANPQCKRDTSAIIEDINHSGLSKIAGTIQKTRIRVSETLLFQVGGSGIVGGLEMEYKIRERTWKQVMVEDWRNNPLQRNPEILQYRVGVEVSVCTQNARRQRLITILGSSTMQNYLNSLSLNWTHPECRDAFFGALASPDPTAFQQIWDSNQDWQIDMGNAISCCLESLAQTGYIDNSLETFWMSKKGPQYLIALNYKSHSWAGFLKDSSHSCSMVVLNDVCLEVKMGGARTCAESQLFRAEATASEMIRGLCVLETSFTVNPKECPKSIVSQGYRKKDGTRGTYKKRWNTSDAADGEKFEFGENGRFRVATALNSAQLLGTWKSSTLLSGVFTKIEKHHHEYRFDEDNGTESRPIDVFFINRPYNLLSMSGGLMDTPKNVPVTIRSGQNLGSRTDAQSRGDVATGSMSIRHPRSRR